jgi:hypothetical protein
MRGCRAEGDGVHIFSGDQGVYQTRKECAALLGLPPEQCASRP